MKCGDCNSEFIGQTSRSIISERLPEHRSAFTKNLSKKYEFCAHILESGHTFDNNFVSLFHESSEGKVLKKLERKCSGNVNLLNDTDV